MNTDEKRLWKLVRVYLPGEAERIENVVGDGVPDVSAAHGVDYWVELKVCRTKRLKPPSELCKPLQVRWHDRRTKAGSIVFVLIRTGDQLDLWLRTNTLDGGYQKLWTGCRKPYNWGMFRMSINRELDKRRTPWST